MKPKLTDPKIAFLTFLGVGFVPKAPGTAGSLVVVPFLYLLGQLNLPMIYIITPIIVLTIISCVIANLSQKKYKTQDPSWIIIDEIIGMLTAWVIVPTDKIATIIIIFITFRFFDIIKIFPANIIDKKLKNGIGVILDDVVSGIYAGGLTLILIRYFPYYLA